MQNTSNVGSVAPAGLQITPPTPLERLRPYQIATLVLPGQDVTVIDASDKEFQAFVKRCSLNITDFSDDLWSFDDRVRLINHTRKYGVDLFAPPNKKSSEPEHKQFGNNSPTELIGELLNTPETALQAAQEVSSPEAQIIAANVAERIDFILKVVEKSSDGEQKEFGE